MRGGQWGGRLTRGKHSYSAEVAGLFVLMGAVDPQRTRSIMEGDICVPMDPQSIFGNFAFMGPLFVSRDHVAVT